MPSTRRRSAPALSLTHSRAVSPAIVALPRVFLVLLTLAFATFAHADVGVGDDRDAVLQQLGAPSARAQRGNREIFMYPHGGRIELIDGKVTQVQGPLPVAASPSSPAPVASPTETTNTAPTASTAKAGQPPTTKTPNAKPAADELEGTNPAIASESLGRQVEKMDTAWGQKPTLPTRPTGIEWPKLLVEIALHFGITLLGLRIAFKVEEMDALWSGVLAIAGIDVALYTLLEVLGPVTSGISSMGAVESGVGALVMVYTIQKFCFNKRLQNAVVTAMSVKLIVRLCHMFVFAYVLQTLFG